MARIESFIYPFADKTRFLPVCLRGIGGTEYQGAVVRQAEMNCWYQILYGKTGRGHVCFEGKEVELGPGDVFFSPRFTSYAYYPDTGRWETRWMVFDGVGMDEWMKSLGMDRCMILHPASLKEMDRLFDRMMVRLKADPVGGGYACSGWCMDAVMVLHDCILDRKMGGPDGANEMIMGVIQYIEQGFREDLPVEDLVKNSGVSHQYLGRVFRRTMGLTIEQYIKRRRLWEAKRLLAETDEPVAEIARACGFSRAGYFCTVFKEEEHMSPGHYRRHSRNNVTPP